MTIQRWTIPSGEAGRAEWLARRRNYINGSEIGGLFGCSPFLTAYALYMDKARLIEPEDKDNKAMRRGRWQEPAVAEMIRDLHPEWQIEKCADYFYSNELGLGCTPDYWVTCPERGRGILQCKNVARRIFENEWGEELPLWIILQTLLEQMLTEVPWGLTGVMVRTEFDDEPKEFPFERHPEAEQRIIDATAEFWASVKAGRRPKPDYAADADIIRAVYARDTGKTVDLSRDNRMGELLDIRERLSAEKTGAEKELKAITAEIAEKMGDATYAIVPGWDKVSFKTQMRKGYVVEDTTFRVLRAKRAQAR